MDRLLVHSVAPADRLWDRFQIQRWVDQLSYIVAGHDYQNLVKDDVILYKASIYFHSVKLSGVLTMMRYQTL